MNQARLQGAFYDIFDDSVRDILIMDPKSCKVETHAYSEHSFSGNNLRKAIGIIIGPL